MRFYEVTLRIEGLAGDVHTFHDQHLADGRFSFNSAVPMPPELEFDMNNFVEDGYNALFGEWRKLSHYWMFKEAAAVRGYSFPLGRREQVVTCIEALGEPGVERLRLGRLYKTNLERFGYGHAQEWRKAHWGTAFDIFDVVIEHQAGLIIRFVSPGAPGRKIFGLYSKMHSELSLAISYQEQGSAGPRKVLTFKAGQAVSLQ